MAAQDKDNAKVAQTDDQGKGREQIDLGEIEDLAGGKYDRSKPIELPEI